MFRHSQQYNIQMWIINLEKVEMTFLSTWLAEQSKKVSGGLRKRWEH